MPVMTEVESTTETVNMVESAVLFRTNRDLDFALYMTLNQLSN